MISIALAILLIVGVNAIFRTTGDTLSAGQKVSEANRNEQSLRTVLVEDMSRLVLPEEAPFLMIRSRREPGFVDPTDLAGDVDWGSSTNPTADDVDRWIRTFDPDGSGTEIETPQAVYNRRNHRVDTLRFFARGLFPRQTGANALVDNMAMREAFITYGHLLKPGPGTSSTYHGMGIHYEGVKRGLNTAVYVDPTAPLTPTDNPLNFYVRDWTLGRSVILLARGEDTAAPPGEDDVIAVGGTTINQGFVVRKAPASDFTSLAPLSLNSQATDGSPTWRIQWSRYDLAAITMAEYRWILAHADQAGENWVTGAHYDYRFEYDPRVSRPLDAESAARAAPALLQGCSQFLVEFAGDFMTQDASGDITSNLPDGVIDFIQLGTERRTRWYGMPRDVDGRAGGTGPLIPANGSDPNALTDVLPLYLVLKTKGLQPLWKIESFTYPGAAGEIDLTADFGAVNGMNAAATYVAVWGPNSVGMPKPSMLRIIVGTAPTAAGGDDRIAEYVFSLK